jgi:hypothetical protein
VRVVVEGEGAMDESIIHYQIPDVWELLYVSEGKEINTKTSPPCISYNSIEKWKKYIT